MKCKPGSSSSAPRPDNTFSAEVPCGECPSRAGLQITFEAAGVCRVTEPDRDNDTPRSILRRMSRPTCVMGSKPTSQILRQANVVLLRMFLRLQEIDDVATGHAGKACKAPAVAKSPAVAKVPAVAKALAARFALAMAGSLRSLNSSVEARE